MTERDPAGEPDSPADSATAPEPAPPPEAAPDAASATSSEPMTTPSQGGYAYEVVGEPAVRPKKERAPTQWRRPAGIAALAIVPALVVGLLVWLLLGALGDDDGGGGDGRLRADVTNLVHAFTQGQGTSVQRFEGALPPGFPDDVPTYPDAEVVASISQVINDADAGYLVVYDTSDGRDDVAAFFEERFAEDPWQIDAGQDGRDSSFLRFTKIDDADVSGVVLSAESKDDDVTTIVVSVQIVSGADSAERPEFEPGVTKALPRGFPSDVPQYPDSVILESAYQKAPRGDTFIISFVTEDSVESVLEYYDGAFNDKGWTVAEGDASESELVEAQALTFTAEDPEINGNVTAGEFAEDENLTQVDLQVATVR